MKFLRLLPDFTKKRLEASKPQRKALPVTWSGELHLWQPQTSKCTGWLQFQHIRNTFSLKQLCIYSICIYSLQLQSQRLWNKINCWFLTHYNIHPCTWSSIYIMIYIIPIWSLEVSLFYPYNKLTIKQINKHFSFTLVHSFRGCFAQGEFWLALKTADVHASYILLTWVITAELGADEKHSFIATTQNENTNFSRCRGNIQHSSR